MFCMGCGAELRPHADTCAVCGRKVSDAPGAPQLRVGRGLASSTIETAAPPLSVDSAPHPTERVAHPAAFAGAARSSAPSIGYGDVELVGIPRDAPGRLVLVLALVLAADLQAPWVAFDGTHIAPARFSLPMVLVAGLLIAAAASVVYAPFRQRAYYAAYPVVLGAASFGAAATLTLMVGPLASPLSATFVAHVLASPVVAQNLANGTPVSAPPTLALAADTGLYVFLIGSAILTVAGYQLFVSAAAAAAAPVMRTTSMPDSSGVAPAQTVARELRSPGPVAPPTWAESPNGKPGVVLPGTEGWNHAPDVPAVGRNSQPMRGLRGGPR